MAGFTVSSLSDYTEKAKEILLEGVLYNDDFSRFDYQDGIKYKEYLNFISANPTLQAGDCGLSANGTTTFTEKEITVVKYAYRDSFCADDLDTKSLPQGKGTLTGDMNTDVLNALTTAQINEIKKDVEADLWLGTSTKIDGFVGNISGCTGAISIATLTAVTVTQTNVDDVVNEFIDAITDPMWSRGVLTLNCSVAIYNMYKRNVWEAYGQTLAMENHGLGAFEMWVANYTDQIKIKANAGLNGSNHMILTWDKNLVIGTDEINEVAEAKWVLDEVTDLVWFKSSFKFGTQVKYCSEVIHNMY